VIGSGMTGLETTDYLNEKGCKTVVVEMAPVVAPGTWMQHTDDILPRLEEKGTEILTGEQLCEINPGNIVIKNVKSGEKSTVDVDAVVLALGSSPDTSLAADVKAQFNNVFLIGDEAKVGRIHNATSTAYEAAKSLK
ncbi:MAG: FAD-dependent oxidoreductase, partial [Clostridia bacterium]|nr:FAD-dependent oxidoreductase [Clostridia bacterium]